MSGSLFGVPAQATGGFPGRVDVTEEERQQSSVSRRTMLKRIGAAGAIAWVTPVISSLSTPAFAASQGNSTCSSPCTDCFTGGNSSVCGNDGVDCLCSTTVEGECFCGSDFIAPCAGASNCRSSAECQSGWRCVNVVCLSCGGVGVGTQCLPPCGHPTSRLLQGTRSGARSTPPVERASSDVRPDPATRSTVLVARTCPGSASAATRAPGDTRYRPPFRRSSDASGSTGLRNRTQRTTAPSLAMAPI